MVFEIHARNGSENSRDCKRLNCAQQLLKFSRMKLFRSKREKEHERFYLLPGQGGSAYRRKRRLILTWAVVVALVSSAIFAAIVYWLNERKF